MDQMKDVWAVVRKYHFWILGGVITVAALGVWWMSTGQLQDEYQQNSSQIDSQFSTVSSISNEANHPNAYSHERMEELLGEVTNELARAWHDQYIKQEDVLVWPRQLGNEFRRAVEGLRPIESAIEFNPDSSPPTPSDQEIRPNLREIYQNHVANLLPTLAETIGARWEAETRRGGRATGMGGTFTSGTRDRRGVREEEPIVRWDSSNQNEIVNTHFNWADQPEGRPTTLQVLYAQEDLWVLQELMNIIRRTNGDAEARYQAAIKTLEFVRIGRNAGGRAGQLTGIARRDDSAGFGYSMDDYDDMDDYGYSMDEYDTGSMPGGAGEGTATRRRVRDPAENRYVDNQFNPLDASRLRQVLATDSRSSDDAFIAVAKRMPVRMRVVMDQRKISHLLAECGNARLPIEVRQVRVGDTPAAPAGGRGARGGGGGPLLDYGMDYGMEYGSGYDDYDDYDMLGGMMGSGMMDYGMGAGRRGQVTSDSPYDLPVEIYGIVYIYNPVNIEKLGLDQIETAEESPSVQPPASEPEQPAPGPTTAGAPADAVGAVVGDSEEIGG